MDSCTERPVIHLVRQLQQPPAQQCFPLIPLQHQLPATSQPIVFFSHTTPAISSNSSPTNRVDVCQLAANIANHVRQSRSGKHKAGWICLKPHAVLIPCMKTILIHGRCGKKKKKTHVMRSFPCQKVLKTQ